MAEQLSLLEYLERPTLDALLKPDLMFESQDAGFLARLPENTRFEKKSARVQPSELAKALSAFGNGPAVEGGVVAIGIEDDGTITGCSSQPVNRVAELELVGRDRCLDGKFQTKRLECTNALGDTDYVILVRIFYVENRLVELTDGTAYCRESNRSRRMTDEEKTECRINKGERAFELEPCSLSYPDDFRHREMVRFADSIRLSRDIQNTHDERIFESMRLGRVQEGKFFPNNVCALVFAKDPQIIFPGAYVHLLRFNGSEEKSGREYNVIKDRVFGGTVLESINAAAAFVDSNLREFTEFKGGKFFPVPEYPRDAWYELIVNACVHRSYHDRNSPVFVKIFDDHFEVTSPGGFMPPVTPENLIHKPRNPTLMLTIREYGEVRMVGEGTARIKKEMKDANLPQPVFVSSGSHVKATLFNEIANRTNSIDAEAYKVLGDAIAFSLDDDEKKLINFAIENKKIKPSDALQVLNSTYWQTANKKLRRLVERGALEFHSSKKRDPNSYYIVRVVPTKPGDVK